LAIQYAVAGGAFAAGEPTVDGDYRSAVHSIPVALRHLPALGPLDDPITTGLAEIRGRSFGERKELYLRDRVQDQWDWYERKAKTNDDAADRWRALMFAGQAGGLVAGALKALGYWNLSALGIAAAFTAAAAAWTRTKDYEGLAEAYKVTARELPAVHAAGVAVATEKDWAPYVSDAEAAFSREHTLWLARRG
jgi:hypothetical protein